MLHELRPYQSETITNTSDVLFNRNLRSVLVQQPTGTGKTAIQSGMSFKILEKIKENKLSKNFSCWLIVPRTELIKQGSRHLFKWKIPHGIIAPGFKEMSVYNFHVVSQQTLTRRSGSIKRQPDIIMIDEAHLFLDFQIWLANEYPRAKIIGFTATPERLDGRGLSTGSGGIYDDIVMGKSIPWFTERGYLTELEYYNPPAPEEIKNIKKVGTDLDQKSFDTLIKEKKIYGHAIGHYEEYGKGKAGLMFCHSVEAAYDLAEQFRDNGFKAYCIEAGTTHKKRTEYINALSNGDIDLLTNRDLATYGLDIPRIEYVGILRWTFSKALYHQMIGRELRPFEIKVGENVKYRKETSILCDHMGLLKEHADPRYPGMPAHYVDDLQWNFHGETRRKRNDQEKIVPVRLCAKCFLYMKGSVCSHCGTSATVKIKKETEVVDVKLEKIIKPAKFNDLPPEEKREHIDSVNQAVREYKSGVESGLGILPGPVGKLLEIQKKRGYNIFWVYRQLVLEDALTINVTLLHEIARQAGYRPQWVHFAKKQVKL